MGQMRQHGKEIIYVNRYVMYNYSMKIVSICGSPRKGNSETILLYLQKLLRTQGHENEIILLREKNISRCHGCVEYCNRNHKCRIDDDMSSLLDTYVSGDAYIVVSPNYFQMPTGILKDFIDRSSILNSQNREEHFKHKKAVVITIGTDTLEHVGNCANVIGDNYFSEIGLTKVLKKSFHSRSELKGNLNDVFENGLNKNIIKDLKECVEYLIK